jgi:hypothetical protein
MAWRMWALKKCHFGRAIMDNRNSSYGHKFDLNLYTAVNASNKDTFFLALH